MEVLDQKSPLGVLIDTNVIINLQLKPYGAQIKDLLGMFKTKGIDIVVPQIVEVEALKRSINVSIFNNTIAYIQDNFHRWPINERILSTAAMLFILYRWNNKTTSITNTNTVSFTFDLIIAAHAADYQHYNKGKEILILSAEKTPFPEPYFSVVDQYTFEYKEKSQKLTLYLYKCNSKKLSDDKNKHSQQYTC